MHFVKAQLKQGTRIALQTECNVLFSDLSEVDGGNEEGFDPCELLLASISSGLIHTIRSSLSAFTSRISEIIVISYWEKDLTLPIICNISVDGENIQYDRKKLRQQLYKTDSCKVFPKKTLRIKFTKPKP